MKGTKGAIWRGLAFITILALILGVLALAPTALADGDSRGSPADLWGQRLEPLTWLIVSSLVFVLLVYVGLRPLLSWPRKKVHMSIEEFGTWLKDQTTAVEKSAMYMSGELPPEVYDNVADILRRKRGVSVRVLTEKTVLCRVSKDGVQNKLVELAFSGNAPEVELRTLDKLPPNHIKIFDHKVAWVEDPHPHGAAQQYRDGVVIEGRSRVSVYATDFQWHWDRAIPKRPGWLKSESKYPDTSGNDS